MLPSIVNMANPASDWLMWRRTYNGWGYSPLDQINKDNVKNLQVATRRGQRPEPQSSSRATT
jgi:alcohol dehydrogenase (cytochrome c)